MDLHIIYPSIQVIRCIKGRSSFMWCKRNGRSSFCRNAASAAVVTPATRAGSSAINFYCYGGRSNGGLNQRNGCRRNGRFNQRSPPLFVGSQ
eukprot:2499206-Amphidinium_carterae.1